MTRRADVGTVESTAGHPEGLRENFQLFTEGNLIESHAYIIQRFSSENGREIHRIINNQVETSKIGCQIAEQVLDSQRRGDESSSTSPDPESSLSLPTTQVIR